jgi:hypothetical protein
VLVVIGRINGQGLRYHYTFAADGDENEYGNKEQYTGLPKMQKFWAPHTIPNRSHFLSPLLNDKTQIWYFMYQYLKKNLVSSAGYPKFCVLDYAGNIGNQPNVS